MRDRRERVLGPYPHRRRFRVILVGANGRRRPRSFATRELADAYVAEFERQSNGRTIEQAVAAYLEHCSRAGLASSTVTTKRYRLEAILDVGDHGADQLGRVTPARAQQLYDLRAAAVAADTHRNELGAAGEFGRWCASQGWLPADPFAAVAPIGKRSRGKPQLRIDEARVFLDAALGEGTEAGLAAAMALLMGLRASEVTDRIVRDVDDDARVLWVDRAKTRAGVRHLEVPDEIRPRLRELVAGRPPTAALFAVDPARRARGRKPKRRDRDWLYRQVRRIAAAAGVKVSPHGLRGTASSLGAEASELRAVAAALGQAGPDVARNHYVAAGAERVGQQRVRLRVLRGGAERGTIVDSPFPGPDLPVEKTG